MKNCIRLGLLCACALSAETNYSGVWKANLDASKLGAGPKPSNYMVIIQQEGSKITELIGTWDQRGNEADFQHSCWRQTIDQFATGAAHADQIFMGGRQSRAGFRCSRPEADED
jgi:hypothetical protein